MSADKPLVSLRAQQLAQKLLGKTNISLNDPDIEVALERLRMAHVQLVYLNDRARVRVDRVSDTSFMTLKQDIQHAFMPRHTLTDFSLSFQDQFSEYRPIDNNDTLEEALTIADSQNRTLRVFVKSEVLESQNSAGDTAAGDDLFASFLAEDTPATAAKAKAKALAPAPLTRVRSNERPPGADEVKGGGGGGGRGWDDEKKGGGADDDTDDDPLAGLVAGVVQEGPRCFKALWRPGVNKPQTMDFFECLQCKSKYVCANCIENCHKGHKSQVQVRNNDPGFALCRCKDMCRIQNTVSELELQRERDREREEARTAMETEKQKRLERLAKEEAENRKQLKKLQDEEAARKALETERANKARERAHAAAVSQVTEMYPQLPLIVVEAALRKSGDKVEPVINQLLQSGVEKLLAEYSHLIIRAQQEEERAKKAAQAAAAKADKDSSNGDAGKAEDKATDTSKDTESAAAKSASGAPIEEKKDEAMPVDDAKQTGAAAAAADGEKDKASGTGSAGSRQAEVKSGKDEPPPLEVIKLQYGLSEVQLRCMSSLIEMFFPSMHIEALAHTVKSEKGDLQKCVNALVSGGGSGASRSNKRDRGGDTSWNGQNLLGDFPFQSPSGGFRSQSSSGRNRDTPAADRTLQNVLEQSKYDEDVTALCKLFPTVSPIAIRAALTGHRGNKEAVLEMLTAAQAEQEAAQDKAKPAGGAESSSSAVEKAAASNVSDKPSDVKPAGSASENATAAPQSSTQSSTEAKEKVPSVDVKAVEAVQDVFPQVSVSLIEATLRDNKMDPQRVIDLFLARPPETEQPKATATTPKETALAGTELQSVESKAAEKSSASAESRDSVPPSVSTAAPDSHNEKTVAEADAVTDEELLALAGTSVSDRPKDTVHLTNTKVEADAKGVISDATPSSGAVTVSFNNGVGTLGASVLILRGCVALDVQEDVMDLILELNNEAVDTEQLPADCQPLVPLKESQLNASLSAQVLKGGVGRGGVDVSSLMHTCQAAIRNSVKRAQAALDKNNKSHRVLVKEMGSFAPTAFSATMLSGAASAVVKTSRDTASWSVCFVVGRACECRLSLQGQNSTVKLLSGDMVLFRPDTVALSVAVTAKTDAADAPSFWTGDVSCNYESCLIHSTAAAAT